MSNELLRELGRELNRENVALWLAPDWQPPTDDLERQAAVPWLGVWAESRRTDLASAMAQHARETSLSRLVAEVPDRVEDVLGNSFEIAGICPYFYIDGRIPEGPELADYERDERRREKVAQLTRLRSAVLVISGYHDIPDLGKLGILTRGRELRVVVVDLDEDGVRQLEEAYPGDAPRVRGLALGLGEALRRIDELHDEELPDDLMLLATRRVRLRPLLRTQPPIDQDFAILTLRDLQPPAAEVPAEKVLDDLLTGRVPPWKAIAKGDILWDRGLKHASLFGDALDRLRRGGEVRVICLDVAAEPGSGLTVLLHQLAFLAAEKGFPTLFHRGRSEKIDYNLLRRFLTDLYLSEDLDKEFVEEASNWPAVLFFDTTAGEGDAAGWLNDLPNRLAQDHRRVLIVRAHAGRPQANRLPEARAESRRGTQAIEYRLLPLLAASLTHGQREELAKWATRVLSKEGRPLAPSLFNILTDWDDHNARVPLLACLYDILRRNLPSAKHLGRHLVRDLEDVAVPEQADQYTTGESIHALAERLRRGLGSGVKAPPRADELRATYVALAAFGALQVQPPRNVLGTAAGLAPDRLSDAVDVLCNNNLALRDHAVGSVDAEDGNRRLASAAFYTAGESFSLRHSGFGPMILHWLTTGADEAERLAYASTPAVREILNAFAEEQDAPMLQMRLLRPILGRLTLDHASFIDYLAVRFLRLQWRQATPLDDWKQTHRGDVYDLANWLLKQKETLVRQTPSLLHTIAITAYKSCDAWGQRVPLEQARHRYRQAINCLGLALEHARRTVTSEHPGNLYTTMGLVYKAWGERERKEENGDRGLAQENKVRARECLQKGYDEKDNNVFAAFGLAKYLVDLSAELLETPGATRAREIGEYLAQAIDLLQLEPEDYFRSDWQELFTRAVVLLSSPEAKQTVISRLVGTCDELGFALLALLELGNEIPQRPVVDRGEREKLERAMGWLHEAEQFPSRKPSELADLLRYALFSALLDPQGNPEYDHRFRLLERLKGSRQLKNPAWTYDLAMLAFQVGDYALAAEQFRQLRRGRRYQDVKPERVCFWSISPHSRKPRRVLLRITAISPSKQEGWGRIVDPAIPYDTVRFLVRDFQSRLGARAVQVDSSLPCRVRLDRAGPTVLADDASQKRSE